jgi:hypothetical protein
LFARSYLPPGLLSSLQAAKLSVGDTVTFDHQHKSDDTVGSNSVWASMATSYNYISPAHRDRDAFLSCMFVSMCAVDENRNGKYPYSLKMDVSSYFCFPELKTAVALRPGDVLFFDPLQLHCCSQRTIPYQYKKVYLSSFYLSTKQISGNDNSVPVINDEKVSPETSQPKMQNNCTMI